MDLKSYLQKAGRGSVTKLADEIGAYHSDVSDWSQGHRPVPVRYVPKIFAATGGKVTHKDLRSDWADIWPELKKARATA